MILYLFLICSKPPRGQSKWGSMVALVLLTCATGALSQSTWEVVEGGRYANLGPTSIVSVDSVCVFAVNERGAVYRSDDAGRLWTRQYTSPSRYLSSIDFAGRDHGMVLDETGWLLVTRDGGANWVLRFVGTSGYECISMVDSSSAVVVGRISTILHTTDFGNSWLPAERYGNLNGLHSIDMQGATGFAVGDLGGIFKTVDSGRSWHQQSSGTDVSFYDVWMIDSMRAFAVGDDGNIVKTTNGGSDWQLSSTGLGLLRSVSFSDHLNGVISSYDGRFLTTTDGGEQWTPMNPWSFHVREICAVSSSDLLLLEWSGRMFQSTNSGGDWSEIVFDWAGQYHAVVTIDGDRAIAGGENGRIVRTTDGGETWHVLPSGTVKTIRGIAFSGPATGLAVGDSGLLLRTSDGGDSWAVQSTGTILTLFGVSLESATGIAVGDSNTILTTLDGGLTWTERRADNPDDWRSVSLFDGSNGAAVGFDGSIIQTHDGGLTWNRTYSSGHLLSVDWVSENFIVAVGYSYGGEKRVVRSFDAGSSWSTQSTSINWLSGVSFPDEQNGYAVGPNTWLFQTSDSGKSWMQTGLSLMAVSAWTPQVAFAVGDVGVICRTFSRGTLEGIVFNDLNHDSLWTPGEGTCAGESILIEGLVSRSTTTDSTGTYRFDHLPGGNYSVRWESDLEHEQTSPSLLAEYTIRISTNNLTLTGRDFGISTTEMHVKIPVFIKDSTTFAWRYVWWGVKPGASRGLWGPDPLATIVDSLEGEFEIPPRNFCDDLGIFDARFTDPYVELNLAGTTFGEGGWTDARDFRLPSQSDTFLLSFLPGLHYGGDYPMTIRWSNTLVSRSFSGPVTLTDRYGAVTDMKTRDRIIVSDPSIEWFLITSNSPSIPPSWLARWGLVSIPADAPDASVTARFPIAMSGAYAYLPGEGYREDDTLRPGTGYWVKHRSAADANGMDPGARTRDTIRLARGWNLVGSLSAPLAAAAAHFDPPHIGTPYWFGYDDGYLLADTLMPGSAYWLQASDSGIVVLDASDGSVAQKPGYDGKTGELEVWPMRFTFTDGLGRSSTLFLTGDSIGERSVYSLPRNPPPGDSTYASRPADLPSGSSKAGISVSRSRSRPPSTRSRSPGTSGIRTLSHFTANNLNSMLRVTVAHSRSARRRSSPHPPTVRHRC